ncbi:mitochondrial carrier protein [Histoplasma capsulatum var. duboisii H88]|uniref:Mitochondrial thiamine pyrophosphate carrier 1 n=2 Tax=Ajellomyces capsulatus TaxID=5037 RepID=F0UNK0_AJEC8|nr:mitochondrial carrier [Histoplasma capsulatum H143]EGC47605.1 mitochondrial carrier protein [Histoplasma capsulatum var. duboisii H88]QSS53774.1 mitochondrial carrier protein [Histoplasma capsulatum var. duboisii H88]
MGIGSQRDRDQRVARLWETLDTHGEGQIDLKGFKKGLRKMDHPLKNADDLVEDVLLHVDTSGDGKIQFNEFRAFVERAEKELWRLFESIDHDRNGHLDKEELRTAFANAGLTIPKKKLDEFFINVDTNKDGVITFDEWRDFLLFLPAGTPNLGGLISYYGALGNLNSEGDVHINEPFQGSGTEPDLLNTIPPGLYQIPFPTFPSSLSDNAVTQLGPETQPTHHKYFYSLETAPFLTDDELEWLVLPTAVSLWLWYQSSLQILTESTPHIGYFLAGGMAGCVSRTATAPLDRLKVYLIAQTAVRDTALSAAKSGHPLEAVKRVGMPLIEATKDLWRAGGIRSLFAGNGLNVVKVMPESAIKFGAYEASKRMFANLEGHGDTKNLLPTSQFLAGGIGGMVSQCFVYPLDTLKFRMQCEVVEGGLQGNRLIMATAKTMWTTNGFHSFFRGLPLGLIGMFPYAAIDLTTFEYLKSILLARKAKLYHCHEDDVPLSNSATGAIGAFSGALSASIVYPMNVLRTRLQAQGTVLHSPTYTGIVDVTRKTLSQEGLRGLFRGITPNLLKVAPSVSISYVVYENSKRLLGLA